MAIIGGMLAAIGPISMALYTPAMPEIVHAFGTTEAAVKLTLTAYFAGFALAQLVCGPLSDGFGRRTITFAFMAIYLVASIVALVSPNVEILIAARFLQGVGAAVGVAISRAIVRDLFVHEQSARIMNLIGMILAIGPAFSPVIGGLVMEGFGWHAVFLLMIFFGLAIIYVTLFSLRETVQRDLTRIKPLAILRAYGTLLASRYFMYAALLIGCSIGTLYTLATMLPFVLIDRAGLTATQFGLSMLMQSGSFFAGSLTTRYNMPRFGSAGLVPIGLIFIAIGSIAIATSVQIAEPSFYSIMFPVGVFTFGIAFVMPAMMTATLAPFPHIAGSAAALSGFIQMGLGLVGGTIAMLIGDPIVAIGSVIPLMGFMAVVFWLLFRRLPEPASAHRPTVSPPPSAV